MVSYNKDLSFSDNMDALFTELEEQRQEYLRLDEDEYGNRICEQETADRWMVELLEHVQNGISAAKALYPTKPVEAVCEVANALNISLGDEVRIAYECCDTRCEVFGKDYYAGISTMYQYIRDMVDAVGRNKILNIDRRCTSCGQKYEIYFPKEWDDGRDAAAVKKAARASNTNSSYEFMCLSGMCDACWQKHFNKEESDG